MVFFTTFRCNLRCAMCYAWIKQKKTKELTVEQIQELFCDKLIRDNLEIINITGGEPTLRDDLSEIAKIILSNCKRLRRIDISTNGVNTSEIIDQLERILALALPTNVRLTANISIDGVGETHERVRGVSGIFTKVEQTVEGLRELMRLYPFFSLGFNMTISRINYHVIEEVRKYAKQKGIGVNFTLAAISDIGVESSRVKEKFMIDQDKNNALIASLNELLKTKNGDLRYLKLILTWLKTGRRNDYCAFRQGKAFLLEPDGEMYACGNFRESRIGNVTQSPLEKIWMRAGKAWKAISIKCSTCVSNCYIDKAK
ncbi:MAG: radical SAM protein [Candidatus Omnitrophota bacterium]